MPSICPDKPVMPQSELSASPNRIDIWVTRPGDVKDDALLAGYRGLLAPDEAARMKRLVRDSDQHQFLVTRALTRTVLARYLSSDPQQLAFDNNQYGRPFLKSDGEQSASLSFNITHTNDCVVLGVTRERTVGIDIESTGRQAATLGVANRFFSQPECRALNALPASQQQDRFFAYWTLKESYIKARGMGLAIPLGQFSFDFASPQAFTLSVDESLSDDPAQWRFWQIGIDEDFLVSICTSTLAGALPKLSPRRIVPLLGEKAMEFRPIATSHGWA
ncbi:MAG: 4'-phosphopantetheinyl transferase superfamily protein [Hyphomicrobiales bacterium]|nr:4'-phosphopantetheinyl transferase superfamily protein [Hyphomicrobiales bacterium]MCP5001624.1 4'-phosphopantetheinyl transferase superfamily protein [Hyphomicrobiales bacterium]